MTQRITPAGWAVITGCVLLWLTFLAGLVLSLADIVGLY